MDLMIYFVTIVLAVIVIVLVMRRKRDSSPASQNDAGKVENNARLDAVNEKRQQEKVAGKNKIMEMAGSQDEISNDDVQKLLNVSDATATNYLQELENEGKLKQVGAEGRSVKYTKI